MKNRASNLLRAAYVDVRALVIFMCFLELCLERYILNSRSNKIYVEFKH